MVPDKTAKRNIFRLRKDSPAESIRIRLSGCWLLEENTAFRREPERHSAPRGILDQEPLGKEVPDTGPDKPFGMEGVQPFYNAARRTALVLQDFLEDIYMERFRYENLRGFVHDCLHRQSPW